MTHRPEPMEAFSRAGQRAVYHLLKAAVEGLKAVSAVIEELSKLKDGDESASWEGRVDIE